MSVRVRYSVLSAISSTPAEERDLGNSYWQIVTDVIAKGGSWRTIVPAGSSGILLQLDNISTINLLVIRTVSSDPNQLPVPVTIQINSLTAPALTIAPLGDSQEGHFLMSTAGVTALYASNAGGVDMMLSLICAGT